MSPVEFPLLVGCLFPSSLPLLLINDNEHKCPSSLIAPLILRALPCKGSALLEWKLLLRSAIFVVVLLRKE